DVVVRRLWRPAGRSLSDETTSSRGAQRLLRPVAATIAVAAIVATTFQLGRYGRDINPPFVNRNRAAEMYAPTPVIERAIQETDLQNVWPGRVLPLVVVRTD